MNDYSTATPIMVRAAITRDEWQALRMIALARNTSTQTLVADALRLAYPTITNGDNTDA